MNTPARMTDFGEPRLIEPPHNTEVEAALLGAILSTNQAYDQVSAFLRPDHFYEPVHGEIYAACQGMIESGETASPVTLKHRFEQDERLGDVGGAAYLYDLVTNVVSVISARDYGNTLMDLYERRQGIAQMNDTAAALFEPQGDRTARAILSAHEEQLDQIRQIGPAGEAEHLGAPLQRAMDRAERAMRNEEPPGLQTGLHALDRILGGLHQGDLLLLAARPRMGKTALATTIAAHVAETQGPVLFVTLEMTGEQLTGRLAAARAEVPYIDMRRGEIGQQQYERLRESEFALRRSPLHILDHRGLTLAGLRGAARRLKRREGLSLLVVDYLGLLRPPGELTGRGCYEQIGALSRGMKELAGALDIPVICLQQLNRDLERRDNKTPQLSDLRDSGDLEQDPDMILFVHREIEFHRAREPQQPDFKLDHDFQEAHLKWLNDCTALEHRADLIVAKHRHGEAGRCKAYFDAPLMRFETDRGE